MLVHKLLDKKLLHDIARLEKEYFKSPWSYEMLASSMDAGCVFTVATDDEILVGYGGFYKTGDITNIAVDAAQRGKGIGNTIVQSMLQLAREYQVETLFLEVRVSNSIAIKLYDKCGFKHISTRKRYYEDGEDAQIFSREV